MSKRSPKPKDRRGHKYEPATQLVRLRLSLQVLSYFKSKGPDWQTRIDRYLQGIVKAVE
jgi:uncharacterized protein (DUF4415 family)